MTSARWLMTVAALLAGCSSSADDSTFAGGSSASSGGSSSGGANGGGGSLGPIGDAGVSTSNDDGGAGSGTLTAIVRDFKLYSAGDGTTNPDFENVPTTDANGNPDPGYTGNWDDHGIVAAALGADGKPTYAKASGGTLTTHGASAFAQWYSDVAGTNLHVEIPIVLSTNADGTSGYDSQVSGIALSANDPTKMFFPIDDGTKYATAFGDQGDPHNYSFTVELHTRFTYRGGEFFRFRGDDDVWVFIDGKLAIDVGGIHGPEEAEVQVDALGLTKGGDYALDFFSAERHKTGSNILFETSLSLRPAPPIK